MVYNFYRVLNPLGRFFFTKTFLRFLSEKSPSVRCWFYEIAETKRIVEITMVLSKLLSFYTKCVIFIVKFQR